MVSHVVLDVPTLFAVTLFITVIGGLLLLFAFLQNRNTPALALWGIGYLVGAAGAALLSGQAAAIPNVWAVGAANALLCTAYGFMWCGARSFEGRRVSLIGLAIGPALWIVAFQFDSFAQSLQECISLVAAISASYALLAARELWYARDRDLISRWPTLVLVIGHGGFLLARIPYAQDLAASVSSGHAHGAVATVMAFEALLIAFCLPFLRVAMSKERAELEQRLAAETDPLTGVPNGARFSIAAMRCSSTSSPNASRRRCCCSISTASRTSTIRPATRPATRSCGPSAISSVRQSAPAICSAGSAARNSPI
jgi:hypothetical protein